jgi:uncharacterized protein (DUF4415 family)
MNKQDETEDLLPEYNFDYNKAKSNRFAVKQSINVTLDEDVAKVFTTSDAVNNVLRAIMNNYPKQVAA